MTKNKGDDFFHSNSWSQILKVAFDTKTVTLSHNNVEHVVHVFPYKGVKVAIPNFPIDLPPESLYEFFCCNYLKKAIKTSGAYFLRITGAKTNQNKICIKIPLIQTQAKTRISNLSNWSIDNLSSSVRRNIRKSDRLGVVIHEEISQQFSTVAHELYVGTINRHAGKIKYNKKYFRMLSEAIKQKKGVFGISAVNTEGEIIGYMIIADHQGVAYYLHGGIRFDFQHLRPMDALFYKAISSAQERGLRAFDMMTSPSSQSNLIRYKEKWGGETSYVSTYTFAFNPLINWGLKIIKYFLFK